MIKLRKLFNLICKFHLCYIFYIYGFLNKFIGSIEKEEFHKVSSEIEKLFPTENAETYYTEFHMDGHTRCPASGKLLNRFDYVKGKLRSNNILNPSILKSKGNPDIVGNIVVSGKQFEFM